MPRKGQGHTSAWWRWTFWVWLFAVLLSACGGSSSTAGARAPQPQSTSATARPKAEPPGFFWTAKGERGTAYLLGSIHMGMKEFYPLPARIERAFERSSTLVLEIDLSQTGMQSAMSAILTKARYPRGDSLDRHLPAETLKKLLARTSEQGLPEQVVLQLKPWALALTLGALEMQKAGGEASEGVDLHFAQRADGKKKIVGLETAEEQVSLFADIPEQHQATMLAQLLDEQEQKESEAGALLQAWKSGDEAALRRMVIEELDRPENRPLFDALFVQRNIKMARRIAELLRSGGTYFVVIGAGHLIGPGSVVDLLKEHGFTVDRS